jgi:hypothetical protein
MSLYWKCQLLGWSCAALYWAILGLMGPGFILWLGVLYFVLDVTIYIGITHVFRLFSLKMQWQKLPPGALLLRIIPSVLVLGLAFVILTLPRFYLVSRYMIPEFDQPFGTYLRHNWFPMYMTGIRLMAIWVLAYYLYHFSARELDSVRENARLSLVAKDARFDHLRAQLNPHFFFNSLNSIKALINADPRSARRAVDLLSDLLRHSLYEGDKGLIPLEEEIGLVRDYLELEKIRFGQRLQVSIRVEDGLSQAPVLPLSIQVLVENAIKHGIATCLTGGAIDIYVESEHNYTKVTVHSPGRLAPGSRDVNGLDSVIGSLPAGPGLDAGLGLKNLEERLQLRFGGKACFQLVQQTDDIVQATLQFPRL